MTIKDFYATACKIASGFGFDASCVQVGCDMGFGNDPKPQYNVSLVSDYISTVSAHHLPTTDAALDTFFARLKENQAKQVSANQDMAIEESEVSNV